MAKKVQTPTGTYAKLRDGSWGVRGKGLKKGCPVEVKKKSGEVKVEVVKWIFFTNDEGVSLASVVREPKEDRVNRAYSVRGDEPCYFCGSYYCDGATGGLCEYD